MWKLRFNSLIRNISMTKIRSTTVCGIYHNGEVALGADGQATMDKHIAKSNVKKYVSYWMVR
ncbi:hypothetical protein GCM10028895_05710 [Pontibacter rugosus]